MTIQDRRQEFRPTSGEAPFNLDEVFFSRTDARGVIESGNYVFRRVAHYEWDRLLGAPHKIIRHPDMPRAVFWLLWDTIKQGRPIGAYVKNRAEDGLYYWVFAVVMPNGDGYLSARIKPTSPLFRTIEKEYAALREVERRFPQSEYASDARLKIDLVNDHLAGKEMEIGRFYERSGKWTAAQIRFQNVIDTYQTTSHAPEALYRLTETSLALGIPQEAKKYAAVLGANYPGSKWYEKAYELVQDNAPDTQVAVAQ